MIIASQNLNNYNIPVPKDTVLRINLAWCNSIDELENIKRCIYAGGIGYISPNGDMDTCIALRTGIIHKNKASMHKSRLNNHVKAL